MTTRLTRVWTGTEWAQIAVPSGQPGKSAYELAVDNGFNGTLQQWFASMRGPTGPAGPAGPSGIQGPIGISIPKGGNPGQVLIKNSSEDYDFAWETVSAGLSGSIGIQTSVNPIIPIDAATGGVTSTYYSSTTGFTYKVHKFTYSGVTESFINTSPIIGKLLVAAGGGGGGGYSNAYGGGGGGGGAVWFADYAFGVGTHNLLIGKGGTAKQYQQPQGDNGENSIFDSIICYGGGGGGGAGYSSPSETVGLDGGSGGGGRARSSGGLGLGGTGSSLSNFWFSNGSNGSSAASNGGAGGSSNLTINITGETISYGVGGPGGGSYGSTYTEPVPDRGNGGYGSGPLNFASGSDGGTGIVIIRYRIA